MKNHLMLRLMQHLLAHLILLRQSQKSSVTHFDTNQSSRFNGPESNGPLRSTAPPCCPTCHSSAGLLTDVVESAAGGWGDLQEARVDEGGERGRRLVFLHVVAGLALRRQGAKSAAEGDESPQVLQTLGGTVQVKEAGRL